MTNRFFKFFIFFLLTFSLCMHIDAAKLNIDGQDREVLNVNISINGQSANTNLPVFVVNERTYVPVRFVSESLGYK
ncbi:MAG: stalk domain-containing protein, partial [Ezakiella massiliensis]